MRTKRITVIAFILGLIFAPIAALTFAHSYARLDQDKRCAPSLRLSKWPKWVGCTMAAHENLAGGLIGAAGALIAAMIAYLQVQRQIEQNAEQRKSAQREARAVAVIAITPTVHAASVVVTIASRQIAINAQFKQHIEQYETIVRHMKEALDSSVIKAVIPELEINDRMIMMTIVSTMQTFVSIALSSSPAQTRLEKLKSDRNTLAKLGRYIQAFDAHLGEVFFRDADFNGAALPPPFKNT